jgi:hypothetical protein
MFYYWLVPILVLALVLVALFSYNGRRKARSVSPPATDEPEPIKRGKYLNK